MRKQLRLTIRFLCVGALLLVLFSSPASAGCRLNWYSTIEVCESCCPQGQACNTGCTECV